MGSTGSVVFAAVGLVFMLAFLFGTYVTWQALGILKWDKFVFDPLGHQTRVLRFILSLVGGFFLSCAAAGYLLAIQAMRIMF